MFLHISQKHFSCHFISFSISGRDTAPCAQPLTCQRNLICIGCFTLFIKGYGKVSDRGNFSSSEFILNTPHFFFFFRIVQIQISCVTEITLVQGSVLVLFDSLTGFRMKYTTGGVSFFSILWKFFKHHDFLEGGNNVI